MVDFNVWAAVRTLKGRLGQGVGFNIAQRLNPMLTDSEWQIALSQARVILAAKVSELSRNLAAKPRAGEILPFPVKQGGGFLQQVEVYVKDTETGFIDVKHFSYKTDTLRARVAVVKEVWGMFLDGAAANPDDYPEEVLGVAYVGTHQLIARE